MDKLMDQTVVFAFMLALALLIERLLEVLKSVYDYVDYRAGLDRYWSARASTLQGRINAALASLEKAGGEQVGGLIRQYADRLIGQGENGVVTISGDLLRATAVRFAAKLIAIAFGIGFCLCFHLDLVKVWQDAWHAQGGQLSVQGVLAGFRLGDFAREVLTGVALGLGAAPLHKIIASIERQQATRQAKKAGGSHAA